MEDTQIRPLTQESPAPAEPITPEAYRRAPTLMAGASGSHREVRVWSPQRWRHWLNCIISLVATGFSSALLISLFGLGLAFLLPHPHHWLLPFLKGLWLIRLLTFSRRFWRYCYISTDESGIAITTPQGSRSFPWSQIQSIRIPTSYRREPIDFRMTGITLLDSFIGAGYLGYLTPTLVDDSASTLEIRLGDETIRVNLSAYPLLVRWDIINLVIRKARLSPFRTDGLVYQRPADALPRSGPEAEPLPPGSEGADKE